MRLVMMGTGPFAVPTFESLLDSDHEVVALVTRPVEPARGRRKTPANPMRDVGQARNLATIVAPHSIKDPDAIAQLKSFDADLFVVCDYGQILSAEALGQSRLGGINLHGSLLPKYRGAAPINWAIYHGEQTTGVTVIHMSPRLDAGPCLTVRQIDIALEDSAVEVEDKLSQLGVDAVLEAIDKLRDWDGETVLGQIQDRKLATKAPRLSKADGQVNWTRSAQQIKNQVRAFKPWPNTFTDLVREGCDPKRLILDQVSVVNDVPEPQDSGTVVRCDPNTLWIATGDGVLSIEQLQPAGKRVMSIADFLRGHPVLESDRFG